MSTPGATVQIATEQQSNPLALLQNMLGGLASEPANALPLAGAVMQTHVSMPAQRRQPVQSPQYIPMELSSPLQQQPRQGYVNAEFPQQPLAVVAQGMVADPNFPEYQTATDAGNYQPYDAGQLEGPPAPIAYPQRPLIDQRTGQPINPAQVYQNMVQGQYFDNQQAMMPQQAPQMPVRPGTLQLKQGAGFLHNLGAGIQAAGQMINPRPYQQQYARQADMYNMQLKQQHEDRRAAASRQNSLIGGYGNFAMQQEAMRQRAEAAQAKAAQPDMQFERWYAETARYILEATPEPGPSRNGMISAMNQTHYGLLTQNGRSFWALKDLVNEKAKTAFDTAESRRNKASLDARYATETIDNRIQKTQAQAQIAQQQAAISEQLSQGKLRRQELANALSEVALERQKLENKLDKTYADAEREAALLGKQARLITDKLAASNQVRQAATAWLNLRNSTITALINSGTELKDLDKKLAEQGFNNQIGQQMAKDLAEFPELAKQFKAQLEQKPQAPQVQKPPLTKTAKIVPVNKTDTLREQFKQKYGAYPEAHPASAPKAAYDYLNSQMQSASVSGTAHGVLPPEPQVAPLIKPKQLSDDEIEKEVAKVTANSTSNEAFDAGVSMQAALINAVLGKAHAK